MPPVKRGFLLILLALFLVDGIVGYWLWQRHKERRYDQQIREAAHASGRRPLIVRLPFGPVLGIVKLYNSLVSKPRIKVEQVLRLREDKAFDHSAARDDFGFDPRSFAEGVRDEVRARSQSAVR